MYSENSKGINSTIMRGSIRELNTYAVFFSVLWDWGWGP